MGWTDKLAEFLRLNDGEQAYVGYPQMQVGLNKPRQAGYATGFLEGATGMDSMQPKNPITDPNYSAYEQGKNTGEGVGIAAMAVPGYVAALKSGAPKAYNALENYMVKSGGMIPLEAYHGTPHEIKGGFDISKVGTGEGAQAYGHGMYFAEAPTVAKTYAEDNLKYPNTALGEAQRILRLNAFDYDAAKNSVLKDVQALEKFGKNKFGYDESKAKLQETLNLIEKGNVPKLEGNLYKVDIPDEYIPNMLDWDKPISQMSPELQKQIRRIAKEEYLPLEFQNAKKHGDLTGAHFYHEMVKKFDTQEGASQVLNSEGIKGIRYLDQDSRAAKGGTSNFVVFDPSEVKILEKNNQLVSRKELIEEQINKLKD